MTILRGPGLTTVEGPMTVMPPEHSKANARLVLPRTRTEQIRKMIHGRIHKSAVECMIYVGTGHFPLTNH